MVQVTPGCLIHISLGQKEPCKTNLLFAFPVPIVGLYKLHE